ncbi:MAG: hypothetical protein MZV63_57590 [Marinilabiliales bacterium]|nr:hypothetical protein [Marinilabiliales bacterium]
MKRGGPGERGPGRDRGRGEGLYGALADRDPGRGGRRHLVHLSSQGRSPSGLLPVPRSTNCRTWCSPPRGGLHLGGCGEQRRPDRRKRGRMAAHGKLRIEGGFAGELLIGGRWTVDGDRRMNIREGSPNGRLGRPCTVDSSVHRPLSADYHTSALASISRSG